MGRSRLPRALIVFHFPKFYLPNSSVEQHNLTKTNRCDENSQAPSISTGRGVPNVVLTEMMFFPKFSIFFSFDREKTRLRRAITGNMQLKTEGNAPKNVAVVNESQKLLPYENNRLRG